MMPEWRTDPPKSGADTRLRARQISAYASATRPAPGRNERVICINAPLRQPCERWLMNTLQTIGLVLLAETVLTLATAVVAAAVIHTGTIF
jgi:hypothetical protein